MTNIFDLPGYVSGLGDGIPGNYTLPGTGHSVPAGLEAVLEYNGLLLNVRKNVDRYKIFSMDGLSDADIRDSREVNTADDGETPYNSYYGGRTITLNGRIETYSVPKLRDMQQALRAAFADIKNEYPLHFRTGDFTKDHIIMCKKISSLTGVEQQQNFFATRDFQITLRASNPRFLSYYQKFIDETLNTIYAPFQIGNAVNMGNYFAQPIFRIHGPSTNANISNDRTGESFSIGSIPFADYLEFDISRKTMKNSLGQNKWNLLADDSDYISFVNGDNPLFYNGDASRVQIWWRDSWI